MDTVSLQAAEFWGRLLEIGFLNLLLSGDNAVVIALAVRALPRRQRLRGQVWGTVGAVALRLVFVGIISALLRLPVLRLVGGAFLVWIAVRLVRPTDRPGGVTRHGRSMWEAVGIILIADLSMSLDNVLAIAAAARGDVLLVGLGVGTSLPLVVWGSGVLAHLMNRHAWIIWLGGGVLAFVAGQMILDDPIVSSPLGTNAHDVAALGAGALALGVVALGWWFARRHRATGGRSERPAPEDRRAGPKRRDASRV